MWPLVSVVRPKTQSCETAVREKIGQVGNTDKVFGILSGSPLAATKAAATLPGVHTKHDIIKNINRQEQLKDRTKKAHTASISIHTHKLSRSNRGEALCREVLLYLFVFLNQVCCLFEQYDMERSSVQ